MRLILAILLIASTCMAQVYLPHRRAAFRTATETAWAPSDIAGLKIWLKSESLPQENGTSIETWSDSSGNSHHATNTTVGAIAYSTNWSVFGGKYAAYFDGGDWYRQGSALSVIRNISDCTVVAVNVSGNNSSEKVIWVAQKNTTGNARVALLLTSSEYPGAVARRLDAETATAANGPTSQSLTVPTITQLDVDFGITNFVIYTNNVLTLSSAITTEPGACSDTASAHVYLGQLNATTSPWLGWIAELIVYVPKLSDTERTNCYDYLKAKFSL